MSANKFVQVGNFLSGATILLLMIGLQLQFIDLKARLKQNEDDKKEERTASIYAEFEKNLSNYKQSLEEVRWQKSIKDYFWNLYIEFQSFSKNTNMRENDVLNEFRKSSAIQNANIFQKLDAVFLFLQGSEDRALVKSFFDNPRINLDKNGILLYLYHLYANKNDELREFVQSNWFFEGRLTRNDLIYHEYIPYEWWLKDS